MCISLCMRVCLCVFETESGLNRWKVNTRGVEEWKGESMRDDLKLLASGSGWFMDRSGC